jgi:hypothetical protein
VKPIVTILTTLLLAPLAKEESIKMRTRKK